MNVVAWTRVSSREQKEGYSLDAQIRAIREKANREGWKIIKEFSVAESAKRNASRVEFEKMFNWVRQNAKKENIRGIVCHKLDRACRNIADAVRLQELEDQHDVRPLFIDNQFGQGAAGQLSFNVMAAMSQYYSDNLREEVLKGMNERAEQGWFPASAPFGYMNDKTDRNEPIKVRPEKKRTVERIFELYARGNMTFELLAETLLAEGHSYCDSQARFGRTALSYILNNRFYIGDITWHGRVFKGKHTPIIDAGTFQACQDILKGRNRRFRDLGLPLAGGLLRCAVCGFAITGEVIRKKLKDGGVREHVYYKCSNNSPAPDHPKMRWKADAIEGTIIEALKRLKLPSPEVADWFRDTLKAALSDEVEFNKRKNAQLRKRESELKVKQGRLLDAFLSGTVDKDAYTEKAEEIKTEISKVEESLAEESKVNGEFMQLAEAAFNLSQRAVETWHGSNWAIRRELLEILSSNRELDVASLALTWNKPFDAFAEQPDLKDGGGGGNRTRVPRCFKQGLYACSRAFDLVFKARHRRAP
jgi:site-specific DNA recombinase